jgi:L-malate glycosyltransferase
VKVALFTELYQRGGVDTFISTLINAWPAAADSFVLVANDTYPSLATIQERLGRPCEVVTYPGVVNPDLAGLGGLQNALRRIVSPVLRYAQIVLNAIRFRRFWSQTGADALIVVNGGYPGGDACRAAALSWGTLRGRPKSVHNFHNLAAPIPWYLWLQENLLDTLLTKVTHAFVTVSAAAAKSMTVRPVIERAQITSFIYNGIAVEESTIPPVDIRTELGVGRSAPLCLMLGTYEARKGHKFLFQAFKMVLAKVPDAHLLVCGFGFPYEIELVEGYRREFALEDRVHLRGFIANGSSLLAAADVLLIASQQYESFGLTGIEAMARGVPVVSTNVGGLSEVIANGNGGYCVASDDVEGYAERVVALLCNEELAMEQGQLGKLRFKAHFDASRMATQYWRLLNATERHNHLRQAN